MVVLAVLFIIAIIWALMAAGIVATVASIAGGIVAYAVWVTALDIARAVGVVCPQFTRRWRMWMVANVIVGVAVFLVVWFGFIE